MKNIIKYYNEDLIHKVNPDFIHMPGTKEHYDFKSLIYKEYDKNKNLFIKPDNVHIITCSTPEYQSLLIDQCNYMNIDYVNAYDLYNDKNLLTDFKNVYKLYIYKYALNYINNTDIIVLMDSRDTLINQFNKIKNYNKEYSNKIIFGSTFFDFPLHFEIDDSIHRSYRTFFQSNLNSGIIIGTKSLLIDLFDNTIEIYENQKLNNISLNPVNLTHDQYIFKCLLSSPDFKDKIIIDSMSNYIFTANGFKFEEKENDIIFTPSNSYFKI